MTAKKTNQTSAKPASSKETRAKTKVSKLSALEAAAKVLSETKKALSAQEMIDAMMAQGYWTSPKGKTPSATLYAALTREIKIKGNQARFQKASPGHFTLA
jgi:HB1, ASXL, restriction endonuclease HTH domain